MNILNRFRRHILVVAAVFNFIIALLALISPVFFNAVFFRYAPDPGTTFPYLAFYHHVFWGTVLIMGIGYLSATGDAEKNKGIVLCGALGKLLVAAFCLMLYFQAQGQWLMMTVGVFDGIFGLLMLGVLVGKNGEGVEKGSS